MRRPHRGLTVRPQPPVVVWVPGDGAASRDTARSLAATVDDGVEILTESGASALGSLESVAAVTGRADIVMVFGGVVLFDGWPARLGDAAGCDSTVATASAMLLGGPWGPATGRDPQVVAQNVAARSLRLRPRLTTPQAGCVLLRRRALDVAGVATDREARSPAADLAAFGERCSAIGLSHVLADDVLAAGSVAELADAEADELEARWPHRALARELEGDPDSPARRALLAASRGLDKLSVTIDGRALGPERAGTQIHALELIAALGRTGQLTLRVLVAADLAEDARRVLEQIEDLELLPYAEAANNPPPPTDIVHRPSQVFSVEDLNLIAPLGRRLVVTQQDLIQYRNPSYHQEPEHWLRYRRTTRNALSGADRVVFFSQHARDDALADDLVEPARASVIAIGADHHAVAPVSSARRPAGLGTSAQPFLLCLGAQLRHKNHAFAVKLLAVLREVHGWGGRLVVAGPSGAPGSVALEQQPPQRQPLVDLGPVDDDEKVWLLAHAAAVVYPSLYEGFGLIPFEAGNAGTPCLFGPQSALAEILPPAAATLIPWDAPASAAAVTVLLQPGEARDAHVELLRVAAARYRWDDTARALIDVYDQLLTTPAHTAGRGPRERLLLEGRLLEVEHQRHLDWERFRQFKDEIGSDGLGLVGPGGVLGPGDQRALIALMSQRSIRRPIMSAARAAYAVGRRLGLRSSRRD